MKRKNIILISLFLIITIINTGIVFADDLEEININDNSNNNLKIIDDETIDSQENFESEIPDMESEIPNRVSINEDSTLEISDVSISSENDEEVLSKSDEEVLSESNGDAKKLESPNLEANNLQSTIYVEKQKTGQNQMTDPTIQNAINSANSGDTIIIKGDKYAHCHFIVNKNLTIMSEVGTVMTPCPSNTRGSGAHGIFYITPEASGTIIKGFTLNDDDK